MSEYCGGDVVNYLEHVEVKVNLNYSRRGDLLIKITSPGGTVSSLTHYRKSDSFFKLKDLKNWTLMTLHLWGETAVGEWKLTLKNSQPQHAHEGCLLFHCERRKLPLLYYEFTLICVCFFVCLFFFLSVKEYFLTGRSFYMEQPKTRLEETLMFLHVVSLSQQENQQQSNHHKVKRVM